MIVDAALNVIIEVLMGNVMKFVTTNNVIMIVVIAIIRMIGKEGKVEMMMMMMLS